MWFTKKQDFLDKMTSKGIRKGLKFQFSPFLIPLEIGMSNTLALSYQTLAFSRKSLLIA